MKKSLFILSLVSLALISCKKNDTVTAASASETTTATHGQEGIQDSDSAPDIVKLAVEDFNNRPYTSLNGLTPIEVGDGQLPAQVSFYTQTKEATRNRIVENKRTTCCNFSF